MNATKSLQSQINAALSSCEFFLSTNNAGEVFGNLRISRDTQVMYPWLIKEILERLEKFEGADIIWRGLPKHGWYAIQFTSTLNHYLSLASQNCNPQQKGRCAPSNLVANRLRTLKLLNQLVARRDQLAATLNPTPASISTDWRTQLSAQIIAANRGEPTETHSESLLPTATTHLLSDPWELPEQYLPVVPGILDRPFCPISPVLMLSPAAGSLEEEAELWAIARSAFGEWRTETRDIRCQELQLLTKKQLGELLAWSQGKIHNTKKAVLIEAILDLNG